MKDRNFSCERIEFLNFFKISCYLKGTFISYYSSSLIYLHFMSSSLKLYHKVFMVYSIPCAANRMYVLPITFAENTTGLTVWYLINPREKIIQCLAEGKKMRIFSYCKNTCRIIIMIWSNEIPRQISWSINPLYEIIYLRIHVHRSWARPKALL